MRASARPGESRAARSNTRIMGLSVAGHKKKPALGGLEKCLSADVAAIGGHAALRGRIHSTCLPGVRVHVPLRAVVVHFGIVGRGTHIALHVSAVMRDMGLYIGLRPGGSSASSY